MVVKNKIKILDFGCGKGYRAPFLGKLGEYFGVDISAESLKQAKDAFPDYNWLIFDGVTLPFQDNYFDEIHAYDVLEHLIEPEPILFEIIRCLKKQGKFIVEVPAPQSEKTLIKINPNYWLEIGHRRIVSDKWINWLAQEYQLQLISKKKKRGIDTLILSYYFRSGRYILSETGNISGENMVLKRMAHLFSEDFFTTKFYMKLRFLWWLLPIWLITQFIGRIVSLFFPKTIRYELVKK